MTDLDQIWAKSPARGEPAGEALTTHLTTCEQAAQRLARRTGHIPGAPARFWTWVRLAALLHDTGKIAAGFQTMLRDSRATWGERHELLSLAFVARLLGGAADDDRDWVALSVLVHHRSLTGGAEACGKPSLLQQYGGLTPGELADRLGPVDPDAATALCDWLAATLEESGLADAPPPADGPVTADSLARAAGAMFTRLADRWEYGLPPGKERDGRIGALLQGAVTLADHVSSAHGTLHAVSPLDTTYSERLTARLAAAGHRPYPHQSAAADVDGHLLLRAPTGSGKTEAALLWAAAQQCAIGQTSGGTPRLFYTLPYLASIDAMTRRLEAELERPGAIGVLHSRAASYYLNRALADDTGATPSGAASKAVARARASRLFRELVRVATPYQLLRGALAGPAHAGILLDAANSVFVLDELHAYDTRRLGYLLAMARLWEDLGGRVAVTSATLPDALAALLDATLTHPLHRLAAAGRWPARHRLRLDDRPLTDPATLTEIEAELRTGAAVLVIANNVGDARELYARLAPVAAECHGDDAADLLHSRFRSMDRHQIERRVLDRHGTGRPRRPGLLVATQVVEVSLDVDFDVLHTSAAPLEALLQRFGRVNRLGARPPADVVVHAATYRRRRAGGEAEWADGVYEAEPTRLGWQILARHDHHVLDERMATDWLDEIYTSTWGRRWRDEVRHHQDRFADAFLDFQVPFDDRAHLAEEFDKMFEGTEAVLSDDLDAYQSALQEAPRAAGRLRAAEYLIPLPFYGAALGTWHRQLGVRVIDADYDPTTGLGQIHGRHQTRYSPGEVL